MSLEQVTHLYSCKTKIICFLEHLYYNGWISSNSFSSVDKQFLVDGGLAGQLEVSYK